MRTITRTQTGLARLARPATKDMTVAKRMPPMVSSIVGVSPSDRRLRKCPKFANMVRGRSAGRAQLRGRHSGRGYVGLAEAERLHNLPPLAVGVHGGEFLFKGVQQVGLVLAEHEAAGLALLRAVDEHREARRDLYIGRRV